MNSGFKMEELTVFSVFEVTRHIRQVLESSMEAMYVSGEISGFVHHSSGHMYFNLKDENATLRCTFFRNVNMRLDFKPVEGMQVICFGRITLFEKGGTYNLNVQSMSQAGLGMMQQKIEQLKKKLQQEGLFDTQHKQPLPKYPERIGIITSPTGAALQDIKNIITRRYPAEIIVYPAVVQGPEAPAQLVRGIRYFNDSKEVDLLILTRGGGSPEDLFCFNDEALVRAVFTSKLPIITAVGHEIDFTLVDFVSDLRAPTPSAAAELAVPDKKDLLEYLGSLQRRIEMSSERKKAILAKELGDLKLELSRYHPEKLWQSYQQRFDMATMSLMNSINQISAKRIKLSEVERSSISMLRNRLESLESRYKTQCQYLAAKLGDATDNHLTKLRVKLQNHDCLLAQLSPRRIREKGWIMAMKDGQLVKSTQQLKVNDVLNLYFGDGSAQSTINLIRDGE